MFLYLHLFLSPSESDSFTFHRFFFSFSNILSSSSICSSYRSVDRSSTSTVSCLYFTTTLVYSSPSPCCSLVVIMSCHRCLFGLFHSSSSYAFFCLWYYNKSLVPVLKHKTIYISAYAIIWLRCPDELIWFLFVVDVDSVQTKCRSTTCH